MSTIKCHSCNILIRLLENKSCFILSPSKVSCYKCVFNICYNCKSPFAKNYYTIKANGLREDDNINTSIQTLVIVCNKCNKLDNNGKSDLNALHDNIIKK
jgi:hypothetical protein